jgi:DNA-binding transcriptional MerR regulator
MVQQQINLSLEELAGEVALTLEHYKLLGPVYDSRVSPVPDARTIRYYTTLGLLDRPWMEGRQARYGRRHLLQVVAIKALQGRGLPLAEVQARLYGMSNEHLEGLLATLAESAQSVRQTQPLRPVIWKEVIVEPGLKLMIEEGWMPSKNSLEMEKRISALLKALSLSEDSNGGIV